MRYMIKSFLIFHCWTLLFIVNALPTSFVESDAASCPLDALSCSNRSGGSCCTPTNGVIVLAQQWVSGFGPSNSFTMHGLWPNTCAGGRTGRGGCDASRRYEDMDAILRRNQTLYDNMVKYWPSYKGPDENDEFWSHEWIVHGTCLSTLDPKCYVEYQQYQDVYDYFGTTLRLGRKYNLYTMLSNAGITPGDEYSVQQIEAAIAAEMGVKPKVTCRDGDNRLDEIYIYFKVKNGNQYMPTNRTESSSCRGSVFYPVKRRQAFLE